MFTQSMTCQERTDVLFELMLTGLQHHATDQTLALRMFKHSFILIIEGAIQTNPESIEDLNLDDEELTFIDAIRREFPIASVLCK